MKWGSNYIPRPPMNMQHGAQRHAFKHNRTPHIRSPGIQTGLSPPPPLALSVTSSASGIAWRGLGAGDTSAWNHRPRRILQPHRTVWRGYPYTHRTPLSRMQIELRGALQCSALNHKSHGATEIAEYNLHRGISDKTRVYCPVTIKYSLRSWCFSYLAGHKLNVLKIRG